MHLFKLAEFRLNVHNMLHLACSYLEKIEICLIKGSRNCLVPQQSTVLCYHS